VAARKAAETITKKTPAERPIDVRIFAPECQSRIADGKNSECIHSTETLRLATHTNWYNHFVLHQGIRRARPVIAPSMAATDATTTSTLVIACPVEQIVLGRAQ